MDAPKSGVTLIVFLSLLLKYAGATVQQQHLITRTVSVDALNDPDWPSAPNTHNDIQNSQTWTNKNDNVRLDSSITIQFNENINVGLGYITFQPAIALIGSSSSVATTLSVPSADVSVSGMSLIINNAARSQIFAEDTTYTMSLDAGVVQSAANPSETNAAFSVQFRTGDFTSPTLVSKYPADNAAAVDITENIVLTFSENVQSNSATQKITMKDYYERQSPEVRDCNSPNVVISGNQVTIKQDAGVLPFLPCQKYALVYVYGCFLDTTMNKNPVASLAVSANYDFWTSCITSYSPVRNTIDHLISTNVVLTFSEVVQQGAGNIVLTPLGEAAQSFDVNDAAKVKFEAVGSTTEVTVIGENSPYLCQSLSMQNCKGKPVDVSLSAGVIRRTSTSSPSPSAGPLPLDLTEQLVGDDYRFTLKPADLTPPRITVVSMYGISETVIRVTIRLDESGTTYCRAYPTASFSPVSQGGDDVPTLNDCTACTTEIKSTTLPNFVGSSTYDPKSRFAEHEVDVTGLTDKTMYWVYCYSHDIEIPTYNTVTSAQMLKTERQVRTLDTTPPTFGSFICTPKAGTEDTINVQLSLSEAGRAYCKVVNRGFISPSPNAVIAEGFFADTIDTSVFTIDVNEITTGLGATGMEPLRRKTDYDVYCWAQDAEGYPYHGPNGMADVVQCPSLYVTTLDLTPPEMRFVMAESISKSQIIITLQVNEGARVWCAAWDVDNDPGITANNYRNKILGKASDCFDNKGRPCGSFWVYDLDDLEDSAADGMTTIAEFDSPNEWRYNQDVDIVLNNLVEEKEHPHIYCFAEDDEQDGVGGAPNPMIYDAVTNAGPMNVHTIKTGIGTVWTLDETPPSFTKLAIFDPTAHNDRIIVTFSLNEAGTAYCRVTRSDSGETTLRINRILTANYGASVTLPGEVAHITVDKLEARDTETLYEASQYDVYCWAKDSAVDTQGQPRPNYATQAYVDTPVGSTIAHALTAPQGGKTLNVWVQDKTPPQMIFVSTEALAQSTIQVTLQLNEPGTVWCQPVLPSPDGTYVDKDYVTSGNYKNIIQGRFSTFSEYVHTAFVNVDVEVNQLEKRDGTSSTSLAKETPYNIYCFAEDDWKIEATSAASNSINFNIAGNEPNEITYAMADTFLDAVGVVTTLDLTPPAITVTGISSLETSITVTLKLDETGTAWCQAVRHGFNPPTILEILDTNFYNTFTYTGPSATTEVVLLGYDRPKNADNSYLTPLMLGTDYDVYCYADDDLCTGCKVTNGVSFAHVQTTKTFIRTKDHTVPNMRFVAAESIAMDQILVTLQVDEGAKVWCAAWMTDPLLTSANYESTIKGFDSKCQDNKGRKCGTFWVYDLDDLEDNAADGVSSLAEYESDLSWRYNQDVDIILYGLTEEQDYAWIYCYAEDDEDDGVGGNPIAIRRSVPEDVPDVGHGADYGALHKAVGDSTRHVRFFHHWAVHWPYRRVEQSHHPGHASRSRRTRLSQARTPLQGELGERRADHGQGRRNHGPCLLRGETGDVRRSRQRLHEHAMAGGAARKGFRHPVHRRNYLR
eukprot:TRINITY_DN14116_c0_g3_i2.p2 TRINITY_DN14116_c0_g3~~TRINITY_DN14116_c0_g3_i2.p2  ORF type:complete len:1544 (+),score=343.05 TRINITY_DN14116_c0_g3_i2:230-4861(+)